MNHEKLMNDPAQPSPTPPPLQVKRTGPAALLLAFLRPGDARGAKEEMENRIERRLGAAASSPLKV